MYYEERKPRKRRRRRFGCLFRLIVLILIIIFACVFSYILIKAVSNTYGVNQKISVFGFLKTFGFLFVA